MRSTKPGVQNPHCRPAAAWKAPREQLAFLLANTFQRENLLALHFVHGQGARVHRHAVDEGQTGAARLLRRAAILDRGDLEILPQHLQQQPIGSGMHLHGCPIEGELIQIHVGDALCNGRRLSGTAPFSHSNFAHTLDRNHGRIDPDSFCDPGDPVVFGAGTEEGGVRPAGTFLLPPAATAATFP